MSKSLDGGAQEAKTVTRILRDRSSRRYFRGGDWTGDPVEGKAFSDVVEAIRTCVQHGLYEKELELRLNAGAPDAVGSNKADTAPHRPDTSPSLPSKGPSIHVKSAPSQAGVFSMVAVSLASRPEPEVAPPSPLYLSRGYRHFGINE